MDRQRMDGAGERGWAAVRQLEGRGSSTGKEGRVGRQQGGRGEEGDHQRHVMGQRGKGPSWAACDVACRQRKTGYKSVDKGEGEKGVIMGGM